MKNLNLYEHIQHYRNRHRTAFIGGAGFSLKESLPAAADGPQTVRNETQEDGCMEEITEGEKMGVNYIIRHRVRFWNNTWKRYRSKIIGCDSKDHAAQKLGNEVRKLPGYYFHEIESNEIEAVDIMLNWISDDKTR